MRRRRLLAWLAEGRERRVVLICAPAGFGKTILAAQLVAGGPRTSCWMQLQDADNDPVVLLTDVAYMLGGLDSISPQIPRELESPAPRILEVVVPLLREELAGFEPFLLVLDDVDVLTHPGSLAVLSFLVDHAPPGSQLVLTSRAEPQIPLARLRAAGEVLDVRAADLALDLGETRELLSTGGITLSEEQVEQIRERAEGWAAGIALAMFPSAGREDTGDVSTLVAGGSPDAAADLMEEAVERQPPDVRRFLLASSILRRMSPEVCDAALGITDSGRLLDALERASLFVTGVGEAGGWYRYHHLFRELLQNQLRRDAPAEIRDVLRRASAWHEDHGDPGEAFEYAHASGDLAHAGRILLRHGHSLVGGGQVETVRMWLRRCTPAELASDPHLAVAGAWFALLSGDALGALRLASDAEAAGDLDVPSADGAVSLRCSLAAVRATLGSGGVTQMLRDAEFVCMSEGDSGTRTGMYGWRAVATAHLLAGRTGQAIEAFAKVLDLTRARPELSYIRIYCLGSSALAAADAGDWRRARKWAREARALATDSGLGRIAQSAAAYTAHAAVLCHDGLFPQAANALENARTVAPLLRAVRWAEGDINLRCAELSLDLGDAETALEHADTARTALSHYPDPGMLGARLAALDARLSSGGQLGFTPSELRLVPFLASHLSLQEIGDRVQLSRATIKTHADSVYRKLEVSTRSGAVDRLEALGVLHRPVEASPPVSWRAPAQESAGRGSDASS